MTSMSSPGGSRPSETKSVARLVWAGRMGRRWLGQEGPVQRRGTDGQMCLPACTQRRNASSTASPQDVLEDRLADQSVRWILWGLVVLRVLQEDRSWSAKGSGRASFLCLSPRAPALVGPQGATGKLKTSGGVVSSVFSTWKVCSSTAGNSFSFCFHVSPCVFLTPRHGLSGRHDQLVGLGHTLPGISVLDWSV